MYRTNPFKIALLRIGNKSVAFQRFTLPLPLASKAAPECVIDMHTSSQHLHVKALLQDASVGKILMLPTAGDHVQIQRAQVALSGSLFRRIDNGHQWPGALSAVGCTCEGAHYHRVRQRDA